MPAASILFAALLACGEPPPNPPGPPEVWNRAIALLDQDRGIVLDAANVTVSDGPTPRRPYAKPRNTNAADD
jgi:hypothetical protein